jgi:8-oxo-dGTP pyrophosphatase MutT (NUDIX family)
MLIMNVNNLREIDREIVSGLIFSKDGKLLMGKKDKNKGGVYSDCWHIPGGGIDDGEDKLVALKRELSEETGLGVESRQIELVDNAGRGASEKILKGTGEKVWCNMIFNVYKVQLDENADVILLSTSDDLVELCWFEMNELQKIKLTPPSQTLFKRLGYMV